MNLKYILLLSCATFAVVVCQEEEPPSDDKVPEKLVQFLKRYGYLKEGQENNMVSLSDAIKSMQLFGKTKVTGKVNKETLALMNMPRCGMADLEEEDIRGKRYAVSNKKWPNKDHKYQVENSPKNTEDMSDEDINTALTEAFAKWSAVVPALTFTKVDSGANLKIKFCSQSHPEDRASFDGSGGILGHAYYPTSGKIHFDDDETWCKTTPIGPSTKYFKFVATHEIGHSLGLKHSAEDASVMAPYYPKYDPAFELHQDDIDGITSLYG